MSQPCKECGGVTAWDDDAGSVICTQCGTLSDPSQSLLTNDIPFNPASQATGLWDGAAPTTLKSFRAQGTNWDLAGQGKEARDRKNSLAMAQFITSLAVSINASGLSPRATILFNQAMATGKFRWGRKAKLVAGASLVVALREYRRPDSLSDIAYLLDEQCPTLVRTLTALVSILGISLTPVDPSIHIPPLLSYLTSIVSKDPLQPQSQPTVQLPVPLLSQLKTISLRAASNTATALSTLLARLGPDHTLNSLPSPPTAVALFILALEAESRAPLSHLGDLAQCLGACCHKTSRGIVMARYKLVQDEVAAWIEQVPWLGKYEQRGTGKGKSRAKISKRSIVARGIADVLQFQEEIWRGKLKPTAVLDVNHEGDDEEDMVELDVATASRGPSEPSTRPVKRQKVTHHPLRDATEFLLNPLAAPLPTCDSPPRPVARPQTQPQLQEIPFSPPPFQNNAHHAAPRYITLPPRLLIPATASALASRARPVSAPPAPGPSRPSLASYVLAAPCVSALRSVNPPTRLQLLAASRAGADDISDEELFGEGELEGMLRPPEEAEEVRARLMGLGIFPEDEDEEEEERARKEEEKKRRKQKRTGKGGRRGGGGEGEGEDMMRKSRVDLEALARFLKDPASPGGAGDDKDGDGAYDAVLMGLEQFSDKDEDEDGGLLYDGEDDGMAYRGSAAMEKWAVGTPPRPRKAAPADDGEVVVDEWRPLSPEAGFGYAHGGQYEEEYD